MPDIIQILPDALANQIAAGEVIQRPASAVKELLENAIDAGATEIKLIIKEGGKNFIQVTDNGSGMSETDARMAFERHATSKLRSSDDLFNITTKGFRGEALASIAAVAKVTIKTRKEGDAMGTLISIEASTLVTQEPCSCPVGTNFTIKNLFYNIPARRKFLKSDQVEFRHILDEFQRVALAHPDISFHLFNGETPVHQLEKTSLRQRIAGLMGGNFNDRLVPVTEETDFVKITGFICKPEFAKKTRGEQFFFVNGRFIKSPYFHHAASHAFSDLIDKDSHPGYFIFMDIDPSKIDVNIHPTKTEVKFEDERIIYAVLRSSIRQALGKYHITPTLDFDAETSFQIPTKKSITEINQPTISVNADYNPFKVKKPEKKEWEEYYKINQEEKSLNDLLKKQLVDIETGEITPTENAEDLSELLREESTLKVFQLFSRYIVAGSDQWLWIIDQHRAHERVLFEKYQNSQQKIESQLSMFPETMELTSIEMSIVNEILPHLQQMGFDIELIGPLAIIIRGTPIDAGNLNAKALIDFIIERFKSSGDLEEKDKREAVAKNLAAKTAMRSGLVLNKQEMMQLIKDLFACEMPWTGINGKPIIFSKNPDQLDELFIK